MSEENALTSNPVFVDPGAEPCDLDMKTDRNQLDGYKLCMGSPSVGTELEINDHGDRDFWGNPVGSRNLGACGG